MFKLQINTDNAAFESCGEEVARILRDLADKVESYGDHFTAYNHAIPCCNVRDVNGNQVGAWVITLPESELTDWDEKPVNWEYLNDILDVATR